MKSIFFVCAAEQPAGTELSDFDRSASAGGAGTLILSAVITFTVYASVSHVCEHIRG